ncbi:MAG: retropepsin-like aspartic protease [Burkholderiaceae bacterium]
MSAGELPRSLKIVTLWGLIGLVVFLTVQWWMRERERTLVSVQGEVVELRRGSDGHYHWPGTINGRAVDFLVDTGATSTAIPADLANDLRLESLGSVRSSTAGGPVTGQVVRIDITLEGGLAARRLRVVALPGLQDRPLLGMDVLGRLHLAQRDGVLRIEPADAAR